MFFSAEFAIPLALRKLLISPMFARITPVLTSRKKDSGSSKEGLTLERVRIICPRSQRMEIRMSGLFRRIRLCGDTVVGADSDEVCGPAGAHDVVDVVAYGEVEAEGPVAGFLD